MTPERIEQIRQLVVAGKSPAEIAMAFSDVPLRELELVIETLKAQTAAQPVATPPVPAATPSVAAPATQVSGVPTPTAPVPAALTEQPVSVHRDTDHQLSGMEEQFLYDKTMRRRKIMLWGVLVPLLIIGIAAVGFLVYYYHWLHMPNWHVTLPSL